MEINNCNSMPVIPSTTHLNLSKSYIREDSQPNEMQRCLLSFPKSPKNAVYARLLIHIPLTHRLLQILTSSVDDISGLLDRLSRRTPVFLLDGGAREGEDGGFVAVGGVGGEDDVFELFASGELVDVSI